MTKHWVVVRYSTVQAGMSVEVTKLWRDYGDIAWGSPAYRVLGYVTGHYGDVRRRVAALPATANEWGEPINVVPEGDN